ncbi:Protein ltv1 [Ascosphaera pollenicola]|nr:Protein ltv1 [Ascosphaera pollenicola]
MPPRKWIDKKNAATYQLFHRSQQDPLIHDNEAQDRILHQVSGPKVADTKPKAGKTLEQLQKEFNDEKLRKNEGEAANFGIYYDDTKYDYMQHLKELGGDGTGHYVEAAQPKSKSKMTSLEDALKMTSLDDRDDMLSTASTFSRKTTYQDQQNIPDAIAGFQPDMDPRLREALLALEDEAYVEDEGEDDIFDQLVADGEEVDPDEFRDTYIEDDEEGWESDATEKAPVQHRVTDAATKAKTGAEPFRIDNEKDGAPPQIPHEDESIPDADPEDNDWMKEFAKFKKDAKSGQKPSALTKAAAPSVSKMTASTMFTVGGTPMRRKKRRGALTNPSAYSMTSSALNRTEGHRLLDDRFERIEALYALDEEGEDYGDDMSMVSGMTGMSKLSKFSQMSEVPSLVDANAEPMPPSNFNSIMDGFLDNWQDRAPQTKRKGAKAKRGKNGNEVIGMRMLDEVRCGLGPARIPALAKKA